MEVTPQQRSRFDRLCQEVMAALPAELAGLFDQIPLVVEDRPSEVVLNKLGIDRPERLLGLHTGIPLTKRSVHHSGTLPTVITIYRLGIALSARDGSGKVSDQALTQQIRKTILHELGHYFGMDEHDLRRYGYG